MFLLNRNKCEHVGTLFEFVCIYIVLVVKVWRYFLIGCLYSTKVLESTKQIGLKNAKYLLILLITGYGKNLERFIMTDILYSIHPASKSKTIEINENLEP